jgi:glucokinase
MSALMQAVGIDIGGTKMAVAAVDGQGCVRARLTLPTEAEQGFTRALDRLGAAINQALDACGWSAASLCGIGIGCAGPVDPVGGLINNPYTLSGWDRCDIVTPLRQRFGIPVFLENDADAALLGECFAGAGKACDPVVMLTFGTGVGGAAFVRGGLYRGVNGEHPELGHVPVENTGPACYCGRAGCLESIASGTAIGAAGQAAGYADAREVFRAAKAGQPAARSIVQRALEATASATWTILHALLPQRIILGGGIIEEHYDQFAGAVSGSIAAASMVPRGRVSVARADLGNDAGLLGGASMAFQRSREDHGR